MTLVIGAAGLMLEQVSGKGLWQYAITISYIFKSGASDLERPQQRMEGLYSYTLCSGTNEAFLFIGMHRPLLPEYAARFT